VSGVGVGWGVLPASLPADGGGRYPIGREGNGDRGGLADGGRGWTAAGGSRDVEAVFCWGRFAVL
jgi:hypothetical protein